MTARRKNVGGLKKIWQQRYAEYEHLSKLTAAEGRFEANLVAHNNTRDEGAQDKKLDEDMENLAAIMSSDKGQVETLTETNAKLASQIKELTATNAQLVREVKVTTLTRIISTMTTKAGGTEASGTAKNSEIGRAHV